MRFNTDNNRNRTMKEIRFRDTPLPSRYRAGPENGYGAQQAYVSWRAGVMKGDHPPCYTGICSGIPKGIDPGGDT
jgi:hypothetical protein